MNTAPLGLTYKEGFCPLCFVVLPIPRHSRRKYCDNCVPRLHITNAEAERTYRRRMRELVLAHYGGRCVCCGESTYEFLAIDHINGDGNIQRRLGEPGGFGLIIKLKKEGFPSGYQVLCHNCNMATGHYEGCPHKRIRF